MAGRNERATIEAPASGAMRGALPGVACLPLIPDIALAASLATGLATAGEFLQHAQLHLLPGLAGRP